MLVIGLLKKPTLEMYWSKDPILSTPFFGKYMSRNRFQSILSNLQVAPPAVGRPQDRLYKVRPFLDMCESTFPQYFKPGKALAVDEGAIPFRGRVQFRVYNPSKPHKYHMKVYQLCDSRTGYTLSFLPYCGRDEPCPVIIVEPNVTKVSLIVLALMHKAGALNKYHHLYTDNFYTSPSLSRELLHHKTYSAGTCRADRVGYPKALKDMSKKEYKHFRTKGDCAWRRSTDGKLLALRMFDKRFVNFVSTIHRANKVTKKKDHLGNKIWRPEVTEDYNHNMNGVDKADQMMQYYHLGRRSLKWSRKMLIHFFDMAVYNAYVLYQSRKQEKLSHCKFRLILADELLKKGLTKVGRGEDGSSDFVEVPRDEKHWPEHLPPTACRQKPYRVCKECDTHKKRKFTAYRCSVCLTALHPECFKSHHDKLDPDYTNVTDAFEENGTFDFDESL